MAKMNNAPTLCDVWRHQIEATGAPLASVCRHLRNGEQEPVCGGDERKARTVSLHCHDPCAAHNTVSSSLEAVSGHRALASASAPHLWCQSQMMDATVSSLRLPREKTLKLMFHRCVVDFSPLQLSRDKRVQLTVCPLELFAA